MADMHKFPRHSVELAQHESVVPDEQIKANKSLKKFDVVLAACAILFLGVMAVAAIAQTSKWWYGFRDYGGVGPGTKVRCSSDPAPDGCSGFTDGTCAWFSCKEERQAECHSNHGR